VSQVHRRVLYRQVHGPVIRLPLRRSPHADVQGVRHVVLGHGKGHDRPAPGHDLQRVLPGSAWSKPTFGSAVRTSQAPTRIISAIRRRLRSSATRHLLASPAQEARTQAGYSIAPRSPASTAR